MKLYEHQTEALKETDGKSRVAYYLDMGLGKTFVGAEKMRQLGARVNLLISQKSKIQDWIEHFVKYDFESEFNMVYDCTKWEKHDWEDLSKNPDEPCIMVVNYELAWRRPELLKLHDFTLMLDESSLIQNKTAKQTKFILKLQPANVILLSGTPCSGKYENLWTQAHLLGWNITEALYNRQYINWKKIDVFDPQTFGVRKVKVVDKSDPYKNVERLKGKFRDYGAVFMKTEEVMALPAQNFIPVKIPKPKEYTKFMKSGIITIDEKELIGDTSLTKRLYARQLCGQYSENKLQAFRELLESTNDRLIVFYNFNDELDRLTGICESLNKPVSQVNGETKDLTAYENEPDSVTFCQYQAGAMGLNLQKANKIIYYTLPERSDLFEQSKKRIHRIGQDKPCFYYVMTCAGTIEEDVYKALEQKRDYTDELFRERREDGV